MKNLKLCAAVLLVGGVLGGFPISVLAKNGAGVKGGGALTTATGADAPIGPGSSNDVATGAGHRGAGPETTLVMASLEKVVPVMPRFNASALPESLTADVIQEYSAADALRKGGDLPAATGEFMAVVEGYPDTPQAEAADKRLDYMVLSLPEGDLDAMEAGLPPMENLTTTFGKTVVAQFYFNRALRLMETDPARALSYLGRAKDLAWDIMQGNLDDPFKSKLVEGFLVAADLSGEGKETRARLSAYGDTLAPCFTSWVIRAMVDGNEPPTDYVSSFASKDAIRQHFLRMAGESEGEEASTSYSEKAMKLARQMLEEQPADKPALNLAGTYLETAAKLGLRSRAVADMEGLLADEPMSIMRWIVRYELAMDSVQPGRSEAETRSGFLHFEKVIEEATADVIDPAINDADTDEGVRGLLMCMLGHAYLGTNRTEEAKVHYEWVLDYYPRESHPGDSAEYSLAELQARQPGADPAEVARQFETFAYENPSGSYSKSALLRAGSIREAMNDVSGARGVYQKIVREYPDTASAKDARTRISALGNR